jgi:hypothetical protein
MSTLALGIIRQRLVSAAPKALLGAPPRIYRLAGPQAIVRPYLIYGRVGGQPEYHMGGEGGLGRHRVQVDGYTDEAADLDRLDELLRMQLSGFRGAVQVDGVNYVVRRLHLVDESQGVSQPMAGGNKPVFTLTKEFELDAFQTIPSN